MEANVKKNKQKKKGNSLQQLMGIQSFTPYGLKTNRGTLLFYNITPTNISVLSRTNIEIKIRHLMNVLSAFPSMEIVCTDSSECFDENKLYLQKRIAEEPNPRIREILAKDLQFLDQAQVEMASARQFLLIVRCKNGMKQEQIFQMDNNVSKLVAEQNFEIRRLQKPDLKRFLAIYFEASMSGETMPDMDGEQYLERVPRKEKPPQRRNPKNPSAQPQTNYPAKQPSVTKGGSAPKAVKAPPAAKPGKRGGKYVR